MLLILLTASCNSNVDEELTESVRDYPAQTFLYECEGLEFVARIEGEKAWLFLPGNTVALPHLASASGARYKDESTLFWSKGEEAMLELNGTRYSSCRNNRVRAVWEHAKLNGVDFRAVGNEPGWHLEIRNNNGRGSIDFVTDYGDSSYSFDSFKRGTEQAARRTLYSARSGEHQLEVILEGMSCSDTMVDVSYETTVTVHLDDREFRGCGKALH